MNQTIEVESIESKVEGRCEPPRDRAIWLVANIATTDGAFHMVDPFEGAARWSEESRDWHDVSGMSIRGNFEAKLIPLHWSEIAERVAVADESEFTLDANIYFWDEQTVGRGRAGFYALAELRHSLTGYNPARPKAQSGPWPSLQIAAAKLRECVFEVANTRLAR